MASVLLSFLPYMRTAADAGRGQRAMMSKALLSSKDMCWCTPKGFFQKLDNEFHFVLDAAATDRSAKCRLYFTPEIDALVQSWDVGGGGILQPTIRATDRKMDPESIRRIAALPVSDRAADTGAHGYQLFPRLHIRKSGNPFYTGAVEIHRRERARKRCRTFSVDGGHIQRTETGGRR